MNYSLGLLFIIIFAIGYLMGLWSHGHEPGEGYQPESEPDIFNVPKGGTGQNRPSREE